MKARNIKPGFFRDAELLEVSLEARYLFIGLWCLADREGKLKDQSKQIRIEIFPETKTRDDIETLLNLLAEHNLIIRYVVDNKKYIKIRNFLKHQSPHHTEKKSDIPDPPVINGGPQQIHGDSRLVTVDSGENPPDSLNDDSLNDDLLKKDISVFSPDPKSVENPKTKKTKGKNKTPLPEGFGIAPEVREWAAGKGYDRLDEHLEAFKDLAQARGYQYADWNAALKNAIRGDWAKLRGNGNGRGSPAPPAPRPRAPSLPIDPPGILIPDPACPICRGRGIAGNKPCQCLHPENEKHGLPGQTAVHRATA
jgi:hypothetical protein